MTLLSYGEAHISVVIDGFSSSSYNELALSCTISPIHSFADEGTLHAGIHSDNSISDGELEKRSTQYCTLTNKKRPSAHSARLFQLVGLKITEDLISHEHISSIAKYFLHDFLTLYKVQIRPSLEYCSHDWGARRATQLVTSPTSFPRISSKIYHYNYRPIAMLSVISKVMERCIHRELLDDRHQRSTGDLLTYLLSVFGNEAPHHLSDDPRVGAPKTAVTQENVDAVRKLIIEDRHVTYHEIEASLKISIQKNLHEQLGVRKLVSRWILHLLTEEQKADRVNWCQNTIVSGDESWIYCYEPENKRQSAVWVFQGKEKPTKRITATVDWYTTICLPKVITELRKIKPKRRIILHQCNASSHTDQKTRQYLTEENVEILDHPSYSPDLSPKDFFIFPKTKNRLCGQRFQSPKKSVDAFKSAVLDLPANKWNKCFENWFERMQTCIILRGEYFEKQ
ncbi:unnamed protein product [Acanthoscelides obtectus]|uniref:Transposase n=1 Tax=Acanthoscelides obtectus TaxID=200917 RepID=A0A9P0K959_ACAOB|nr:unnamed protein product [Acanthoscelides obtectus]CAK1648055.1 Histone-lysine N-methyltransferase SETMAR [Acanthoscelides obtectus]